MKRTLSLRREALAELTPAELGGVVGGNYTSPNGLSCGVRDCVDGLTPGHVTTDVTEVTTLPSQLLTCGTCVGTMEC